jgi:hypothetical protein
MNLDSITIGNKWHGDKGINVMRPSLLGNPFVIGTHGTREQVIEKYRCWLRDQYRYKTKVYNALMVLVERVSNGEDIVLVCCCSPKPCHAEVIKDAIFRIINRKTTN